MAAKSYHQSQSVCYISNELCDRSVYIPLFRRVRTSIINSDLCWNCSSDQEYYFGGNLQSCRCIPDPEISYQVLIVSTLAAQRDKSPNEAVFIISVREGICRYSELDGILENPPNETANFSIFDSLDCYSVDTNKDLVSQYITSKPPPQSDWRLRTVPNEVTYHPSDYKGRYQLSSYIGAFDVICGKILSGVAIEGPKANPHMGKRKKRAKD